MWNPISSTPSGVHQGNVVSTPELQALFQEVLKPGDAGRLAFGIKPAQSMSGVPSTARDNWILSALTRAEHDALLPHLEPINLASGQVIGQPGHAVQHVYFPLSCSVSWVSHTADGESAELALVGRDGMTGVPLVLGGLPMQHTLQVQCGGQALRMGSDVFLRMLGMNAHMQKICLLYVQWQMAQMAQSIVCSRHHAVSERLSHWLLSNAHAANREQLYVTHEAVSHMLGVRRESITQAAGRFQAEGLLANSRGKITLKNPDGLRRMACECHARSRAESQRYLHQLSQLAQHHDEHQHMVSSQMLRGSSDHLGSDLMPANLPPYGITQEETLPMHADGDLQKYVDAYDFAPVGFVTLDGQGKILQTNLAGAIMLDIQRSQCQHHLFADFLDPDSQSPFARFHQEVLGGQCRRHCMVQLMPTAHRGALSVRIDATADEWGMENRMVLIDVSDQWPREALQSGPWLFQPQKTATTAGGWRV